MPHRPHPGSRREAGRARLPLTLTFDGGEAEVVPSAGWSRPRRLRIARNADLPRIPGLAVFAPARAKVVRRDKTAVLLALDDASTRAARRLVAAEGQESATREAAGILVACWDYRPNAIVCTGRHDRPHGRAAIEHVLLGGAFALRPLLGDGGDGRTSAMVWTERRTQAGRVRQGPRERFARERARRFGDTWGAVTPVGLRWRSRPGALLAHRSDSTPLALIGDAAAQHPPDRRPGRKLGRRDAPALGRLVVGAVRAGRDPGAASLLAAWRAERARGKPAHARRHRRAGSPLLRRAPIRLARDLGLAAVARWPGQKRVFIRTAMGFPWAWFGRPYGRSAISAPQR
ncbi:MAG: ubiquinone biosynthesis protein UbiH [Acetobacteraceae bacterium]|nr:ubiquinone biosynthesis protein UbiH [Acetobacteraceae bacterium]